MVSDTSSAGLGEFFAAHAALLGRLHAQSGAEGWGVSHEEFAEALYRSARHRFGVSLPADDALAEYLGALHREDLALACALRKGSALAWEAFVASYRPGLYAAARTMVGRAGEARARELADSLYAELYGFHRVGEGRGEAGRRPLLDYYHGRSRLSTWLRTVLAQRHVDALRETQRCDPLNEESMQPFGSAARAAAVAGSSQAPQDNLDRARLLPRLRQAIVSALAAAPAADRLLLSLYYVQDMTLAQIARLQSVHEATISRQLDRIRGQLRRNVEHALAAGHAAENGATAQPGLSPQEVELCFSYALEDWGFDLGPSLAGAERAEGKEV